MRRQLLALATGTTVLLLGGAPAGAQQGPGGPMMQQEQQQQQRPQMMQEGQRGPRGARDESESDDDGYRRGRMGRGDGPGRMHGHGWGFREGRMRDWRGGRGAMMGPGMMGPGMMRMMIILMDVDGDGSLSLQEAQAGHERIFRAIDANKDGRVTFEEMQSFRMNLMTPPQQP
jgi:hypothetical protein